MAQRRQGKNDGSVGKNGSNNDSSDNNSGGNGEKKCAACRRRLPALHKRTGKYCAYHARALEELIEHHKAWAAAYGEMSWNAYLGRLVQMKETGTWVKEVIDAENRDSGNNNSNNNGI